MLNMAEAAKKRVGEVMERAAAVARGDELPPVTLPTGFASLDKLGGLELGILTTVGASTGVGKSMFALNLVRNVAAAGHCVQWYSFEDPLTKTMDRVLSHEMGLSSSDIGRGILPGDMDRRVGGLDMSWMDRVLIRDERVPLADLPAGIAAYNEKVHGGKTRLVVVDYAQILGESSDKMEREMFHAAKLFQDLAKKYNMAFVLFSQLKTHIETRGRSYYETVTAKTGEVCVDGYRPSSTTDLAWSATIGQLSKAVWLLFRPRWAMELVGEENVTNNTFEVGVVKASFSETGRVYLKCDMAHSRIWDETGKSKKEEKEEEKDDGAQHDVKRRSSRVYGGDEPGGVREELVF